MHWKRPQKMFLVIGLSPWQSLRTGGEGGVYAHLKWGWYLNAVKFHDHSSQNLADFGFGNEVRRQKEGSWVPEPSPCAWERLLTYKLGVPEAGVRGREKPGAPWCQACSHTAKLSNPKARVLNVVFSFCADSSKPSTFLYVFVFLFEYEIFQWNININIWLVLSYKA